MLPDAAHLMLFIPAIVAITLLPGPDMLFVAAQTLRGGRRHGLACIAGIATGLLVHTALAALGLSALLVRSATAFTVVKEIGAAYLIVLGVRTLLERDRPASASDEPAPRREGRNAFAAGFVTNVLNPKVVLFMLAFMPQFVDPARGHVGLQFATLGLMWDAFGVLVLSIVALTAAALDRLRRQHAGGGRAARWVTGGIFLSLGIRVAIPDAR